jgi:hypothetical protein
MKPDMIFTEDRPDAVVQCPRCKQMWAWLGDQGACIAMHQMCLSCALLADPLPGEAQRTEEEQDALVAGVIALRESREQRMGRRIFPCVFGPHPGCKRCGDRGWIVGYPPGCES